LLGYSLWVMARGTRHEVVQVFLWGLLENTDLHGGIPLINTVGVN